MRRRGRDCFRGSGGGGDRREAEAALRMALDAQDAAEAAEATADTMAAAAIAAAMTELHIDGTVKTVGESSVDAAAGMLITSPDRQDMITGCRIRWHARRSSREGQEFVTKDRDEIRPTTDEVHVQAVAAGSTSTSARCSTRPTTRPA